MIILATITEQLLTLNRFGTPKVLEDEEAIYTIIIRLILLEPGTIQSHPDMGVGIVSRYRYAFSESTVDLKNDIQQQIEKYLPVFAGADVEVKYEDHRFVIRVIINNVLYDFTFDTTTGTLDKLLAM